MTSVLAEVLDKAGLSGQTKQTVDERVRQLESDVSEGYFKSYILL